MTQNINSTETSNATNTLAVATDGSNAPAGYYNSTYTGTEIDEILTEAHARIPEKEDKPVVVNVEGADVTINVEGNHKYICGELTSLKIGTVEKSARTSAIFFTSGATATELTWSDDLVDIIGYKTPAPNKAYEINIKEGDAIIIYAE